MGTDLPEEENKNRKFRACGWAFLGVASFTGVNGVFGAIIRTPDEKLHFVDADSLQATLNRFGPVADVMEQALDAVTEESRAAHRLGPHSQPYVRLSL
jgi:hypothetical protein